VGEKGGLSYKPSEKKPRRKSNNMVVNRGRRRQGVGARTKQKRKTARLKKILQKSSKSMGKGKEEGKTVDRGPRMGPALWKDADGTKNGEQIRVLRPGKRK